MTKTIEITVSPISRRHSRDEGTRQSKEIREFDDMEDALSWLKTTFGIEKPKRIRRDQKIYQECKTGAIECGWLHRRWEEWPDGNSGKAQNYWFEYWIFFSEITRTPIKP